MDEAIQKFKELRRLLGDKLKIPDITRTPYGNAYISSLTSDITKLGKAMERNGVDIEQLNKELAAEGY